MRWMLGLVLACGPTLDGSLQATGQVGAWTFAPARCRSGDAREFNGVDLFDDVRAVRLVIDPSKGPTLTLANDGDLARPADIFAEPVCSQLDASVTDDDGTVTGSFTITCPGLTGAIRFDSCDDDRERQRSAASSGIAAYAARHAGSASAASLRRRRGAAALASGGGARRRRRRAAPRRTRRGPPPRSPRGTAAPRAARARGATSAPASAERPPSRRRARARGARAPWIS